MHHLFVCVAREGGGYLLQESGQWCVAMGNQPLPVCR